MNNTTGDSTRTVAIYARVSKDRDGEQLAVTRQIEDCEALAQRLGWTVAATYIDNDTSAYSGVARPQYRQMLAAVKSGQVTGILAWHTDRLHRRLTDLEELVTLAERHDLAIRTVMAGEVDLTTSSGRMNARILASVAQKESEATAERITRSKAQAVEAGRWRGGQVPYGYRLRKGRGLVIDPVQAEVIREVTAGLLAGRSLRGLTAELNARGERTKTGRPWTHISLRAMILRPTNAGVVYSGRVDRPTILNREAAWEPIVTFEEWEAVHTLLSDPDRLTNGGSTTLRWLLTFLGTCGECGATLHISTSGAGRTPAYRCSEQGHMTISPAGKVDEHVRSEVCRLLADPRLVAALTDSGDDGDRLAADRAQRTLLERRIAQTAADYDADLIDAQRFKVKTDKLQKELQEVNDRLAVAATATAADPVLSAADPEAAFLASPVDVQREVLRQVGPVVVRKAARRGRGLDLSRVTVGEAAA